MKKIWVVLFVCAAVFSTRMASAQVRYKGGDVLLNFGLGAGYYYAPAGASLQASGEFFVNDAISVGPYIGFSAYRRNVAGYHANYTFFDFGGRGSYHFSKHLRLRTDKLDLYGGALLGFVASGYNDNFPNGYPYDDSYGSRVQFGVFGGARWYFSPAFAANAEVGYGLSPLLLGVSLKF